LKIIGNLPNVGKYQVAYFDKNTDTLITYKGTHADQNLLKILKDNSISREYFNKGFIDHSIQGGFTDNKGKFFTNSDNTNLKRESKIIKESPDKIYNTGAFLVGAFSQSNYSFGYFQNKLLIEKDLVHYRIFYKYLTSNLKSNKLDLMKANQSFNVNEYIINKNDYFLIDKIKTFILIFNNLSNKFDKKIELSEKKGYEVFKSSTEVPKRIIFKFCGRFWPKAKVISFWINPTKTELKKLILDIKRKVNIEITDDWLFEYEEDKLIKLGDYLGHVRKNTDIEKQHTVSPIFKTKRDIEGFGSDKYNKLAKTMNYDNTAQMNYYHKNQYYKFEEKKLKNFITKIIIECKL